MDYGGLVHAGALAWRGPLGGLFGEHGFSSGTRREQGRQKAKPWHGGRGAPLKIGITCYPTFGGSGIVATNSAADWRAAAPVHFISMALPYRLPAYRRNVFFHEVTVGATAVPTVPAAAARSPR